MIVDVSEIGFSAAADLVGGALTASVSGNADLTVSVALEAFIQTVHEEARRLRLDNVQVDLRTLDFMNAECLKALVGWIARIQELPEPERYRIVFLSSLARRWQRHSLARLSLLADDVVEVVTCSDGAG